jgi:hypothetical protein
MAENGTERPNPLAFFPKRQSGPMHGKALSIYDAPAYQAGVTGLQSNAYENWGS